jgi:hypothetical protein
MYNTIATERSSRNDVAPAKIMHFGWLEGERKGHRGRGKGRRGFVCRDL